MTHFEQMIEDSRYPSCCPYCTTIKLFDGSSTLTQVYADENHGLWQSRGHLFSSLEDFFEDCMGPLPDWFSIKCIEEGVCYGS